MGKFALPTLWPLSTRVPPIHTSKTASNDIPCKYLFAYNYSFETTHFHSHSCFRNNPTSIRNWSNKASCQSACLDHCEDTHISCTMFAPCHCKAHITTDTSCCRCSMPLRAASSCLTHLTIAYHSITSHISYTYIRHAFTFVFSSFTNILGFRRRRGRRLEGGGHLGW